MGYSIFRHLLKYEIDVIFSLRLTDSIHFAGPMASTGLEWTALIRTKHQSEENPNPDVQLITVNGLLGTGKNGRAKNMAGISNKV